MEKNYQEMKIQQQKQWEAEGIARNQRMAEKLRVKAESAELNTKIYFDTILGRLLSFIPTYPCVVDNMDRFPSLLSSHPFLFALNLPT